MCRGSNIADWMRHWNHFNVDLYIRYLIVRQNQIEEDESKKGDRENLAR